MTDCIFCKITDKSLSANILYEDNQCLVFDDAHPKERIHKLIIPKRHIASLMEIEEQDTDLLGHMLFVAKKIAADLELEGYWLKLHVGEKGGQEIDHIHFHLLAR
jgi:histidine triad (HIT) family protein